MKMEITITFMNGRAPLTVKAREMRDVFKEYGKNFAYAILPDSDLSYLNLRGVNFHGADLHGVDLSNSVLYFVDLSDADLSGANLCGTNFYGSDLSGTNLENTQYREASFTDTRMYKTQLPLDADNKLLKAKIASLERGDTALRITNAEKIRRMTNAQLADMLYGVGNTCMTILRKHGGDYRECAYFWKRWLEKYSDELNGVDNTRNWEIKE